MSGMKPSSVTSASKSIRRLTVINNGVQRTPDLKTIKTLQTICTQPSLDLYQV